MVSVGASASCFGLVGAFWGELVINYVATDCSLRGTKVGTLVLFTLASLISGISPVVDNFMHLVGFLTGFLIALVIQARLERWYTTREIARPIRAPSLSLYLSICRRGRAASPRRTARPPPCLAPRPPRPT